MLERQTNVCPKCSHSIYAIPKRINQSKTEKKNFARMQYFILININIKDINNFNMVSKRRKHDQIDYKYPQK